MAESELLTYFLLLTAGFAAGFINVTAGGGSTLTLPALIFLGLDSATANGTNRVAILIQNIFAIYSFQREKYSRFSLSLKMSLLTIPGGILGAITAVQISDKTFEIILGIIMIGVILSMIIPRKKINVSDEEAPATWLLWLSMFGIGFYGGFIQVGVGFIIMAALHYLLKISLVRVNMHKVFIVFIYTIPALIVFIIFGNVNYMLGLILAAGNASGGWIAAKFQIKKGEKAVRYFLIIAILIMALKLFGVF